jgi:putative hydrolase of the HAD superfamily
VAVREQKPEKLAKLPDVKVVFFDVGGTLVYGELGHIDILHEALLLIGYDLTRDEVARANDQARQAVARRRRRVAARFESPEAGRMWLNHLAEALDLDLRGPELEQALAIATRDIEIAQTVVVDPEAKGVLDQLRRRDLLLGVISNWNAKLREYLEGYGLARYFEVIIASESAGSQKPHREIFLKALTTMGCAAKHTVHVGDDYWTDVVGARQVGIRPILIDRGREDLHQDCIVIRNLPELLDLI